MASEIRIERFRASVAACHRLVCGINERVMAVAAVIKGAINDLGLK
jgi:hypothetical protein